ncbi:MAG: hypothetical protein ACK5KQ_06630 [Anaerorhabdus sp.]
MGKYSRTERYKELRDGLENQAEEKNAPNDLSQYLNRLNKIDENEFETVSLPKEKTQAKRVRQEIWMDDVFDKKEMNDSFEEDKATSFFNERFKTNKEKVEEERLMNNTQKMKVFDNEYLDEEILNEVKKYNQNQGITTEDQLQSKLLKEIRGEDMLESRFSDVQSPNQEVKINRRPNIETSSLELWNNVENKKTVNVDNVDFHQPTSAVEKKKINFSFEENSPHQSSAQEIKTNDFQDEFIKYKDQQLANQTMNKQEVQQVQNYRHDESIEQAINSEIAKETSQMKVELNGYKDNLNEMEEKFHSSNRMLNFILIVFILLCLVVVGIAIYWILLNRGFI